MGDRGEVGVEGKAGKKCRRRSRGEGEGFPVKFDMKRDVINVYGLSKAPTTNISTLLQIEYLPHFVLFLLFCNSNLEFTR